MSYHYFYRYSSVHKIFMSAIFIGAYCGLLFQQFLFTARSEEGEVIDSTDLGHQEHANFFQVCVRLSVIHCLSLLSKIPHHFLNPGAPLLHKILLNVILPKFLTTFAILGLYRRIDKALFDPIEKGEVREKFE